MTLSRKIAGSVARNQSTADRQLVQFEAGPSAMSPGVSGTGKTAVEYLAASGGQPSGTLFGTSSVKRKASDDEFVSSVPRNVALSFVMSGPAYRVMPKNTLQAVFQNLQRAARAQKVSRIVQRLAL